MYNDTVLIVEDNRYNLDMARDLLTRAGFQTLEAYDADSGIQLAKQKRPDLILMDMHLPSISGYEASRIIKSDPSTEDIPIVGFTALAMNDEKQMALNSGCSGVICKPIDVDTFAQTVSTYLHDGKNNAMNGATAFEKALKVTKQQSIEDKQHQRLFMEFSHDMQAPIRKINQFVEILRKSDRLGPEEIEYLDGIDRSSQKMQKALAKTLNSLRQSTDN